MRIIVVGATGTVGQAVCREALARGWSVAALARGESRLRSFAASAGQSPRLTVHPADLSTADGSGALTALMQADTADAVVTATNAPARRRPALDWPSGELVAAVARELLIQHATACAVLPSMRYGAVYLTVGGGTADIVIPGYVNNSMAQAAQRMMVRALAAELHDAGVHVRELLVQAMIAAEGQAAPPAWVGCREVAVRICDVLADPGGFPGPVLTIRAD